MSDTPRARIRSTNLVLGVILLVVCLAVVAIYSQINRRLSIGEPGDTVCTSLQLAAMLRWEDHVDKFDDAYDEAVHVDIAELPGHIDELARIYDKAENDRYPFCAQGVHDAGLKYMEARLATIRLFYDGTNMDVIQLMNSDADDLYIDYINAKIAVLEADDQP